MRLAYGTGYQNHFFFLISKSKRTADAIEGVLRISVDSDKCYTNDRAYTNSFGVRQLWPPNLMSRRLLTYK